MSHTDSLKLREIMGEVQGSWELSKENIQPLSSGRRMAYLSGSLQTNSAGGLSDQPAYEAFHLVEIEKLEELAEGYFGDDPLQAWMNVVNYMEQNFPNMNPNIKTKYSKLVKKIVKVFYGDERYFRSDKRYASMILTSSRILDGLWSQIKFLETFLENDGGVLVAEIYKELSDLYDKNGDTKTASEVLRRGLIAGAEPKASIDEMLMHVQEKWAQEYSRKLREKESGGGGDAAVRNFASVVPTIGENNEAISIRQNLPPAAPTKTSAGRPQQQLHLFEERAVSDKDSRRRERVEPRHTQAAENDIENNPLPTRWNVGSTQLSNPALPEPPQKVQLYVEEDHQAPARYPVMTVSDSKVLKERKDPDQRVEVPQQLGTNVIPTMEQEKRTGNLNRVDTWHSIQIPRRNYVPDFFEYIKYKPLPKCKRVNRVMLRADNWWAEKERQLKEKNREEKEVVQLQRQVGELSKLNEDLEKKLLEQQRLFEFSLQEKEDKYDDLNSQLTRLTTTNNVQTSQIHRLEQQLESLHEQFKAEERRRQAVQDELRQVMEQNEILIQEKEKMVRIQEKESDMSEPEHTASVPEPTSRSSFVDIHVRSRCGRGETENYSSSPSTEQGTSETSKFNSDECTVATSSFMPQLNESSVCVDVPRKILGMVDCPVGGNDMDLTPAAVPLNDFEVMSMPPPCFGLSLRKPARAFSLYESQVDSFANKSSNRGSSLLSSNKRSEAIKNLQMFAENLPPPCNRDAAPDENIAGKLAIFGTSPADGKETRAFSVKQEAKCEVIDDIDNFHRPPAPKRKSIGRSPYHQYENLSEGEEDDVIVRRHQQTGMDLNMSNLTTALSFGPRPLINSTPEREKTLRNINAGLIASANNAQLVSEEPPITDVQGTRATRCFNSILNDPCLNLSTIQETSRENRSRSTTSSSSGNTMSSTRFGGTAASITQLYSNMTRSSSIPRSASRISQNANNNGYYSDTNTK